MKRRIRVSFHRMAKITYIKGKIKDVAVTEHILKTFECHLVSLSMLFSFLHLATLSSLVSFFSRETFRHRGQCETSPFKPVPRLYSRYPRHNAHSIVISETNYKIYRFTAFKKSIEKDQKFHWRKKLSVKNYLRSNDERITIWPSIV